MINNKMKKRKERERTFLPVSTSNKRACLRNLPGNTRLSKNFAKELKVPEFLAALEVREWKQEKSIVQSYFQYTKSPEGNPNQLMTVLVGSLNKILNGQVEHLRLQDYCKELIRQFGNEKSKSIFKKEYTRCLNNYKLKELEEEAESEARVTSRILTTVEAKIHRTNTQHRLDQLFNDSDAEDDVDVAEQSDKSYPVSEEETPCEQPIESPPYFISNNTTGTSNTVINDPFTEEEEFPTLKVVKEKNLYKYQAPAKNIISPHKPIIQADDLNVLKEYFDICIGTNQEKATEENKKEFLAHMEDQKLYKFFKEVPDQLYEQLVEILQISDRLEMKKAIMNLPTASAFSEFAQYTLLDFTLNLIKRGTFKGRGDERSIFCEVFIPLFKAFGNCLDVLKFTWCEKKAKDADYVWIVCNDFSKERKNNLKLLDGVGTLTESDTTYLIMESSGFDADNIMPHSLNDTLKNIKNGHDSLKLLFSQYRNASFETIKRVNIFSCQIIESKITLIKYSVKSRSTWKVTECRSASLPLDIKDSLDYMRVFELFAYMLDDIKKQQSIFKQLKKENLGLVPVPEQERVAFCLL